jgi:sporulation protein YabP
MNVRQLYQYLNQNIPTSLSCEWDNDGLMCCPDPDREVHKVLIALDVTGEVADEAVEGDFDVVVSHHPLIFKPIRSLTVDDGVGAKLMSFVRAGISVMSFHTRLDAAGGGVNDRLAEELGLIDVESFDDDKIIAYTDEGQMTVKGAELKINRLSVESGELEVEGIIDSIEYQDTHHSEGGGFWGRIFK